MTPHLLQIYSKSEEVIQGAVDYHRIGQFKLFQDDPISLCLKYIMVQTLKQGLDQESDLPPSDL